MSLGELLEMSRKIDELEERAEKAEALADRYRSFLERIKSNGCSLVEGSNCSACLAHEALMEADEK